MLGRRRRDDPLEELTPREREVLELMAEGRSNRGIAEALVVTPHAVEKHVTGIFSKLGVGEAPEDHRRVLAVLALPARRASGIRARTTVPRAARAVDLERPVERADAVGEAAQPAAAARRPRRRRRRRGPRPPRAPSSRRTATRACVASAYLATLVSASATTK